MIYKKITLQPPYDEADGKYEPVLTCIIPDLVHGAIVNKRKAVIICPGGGYDYCSDREAEPVALRFAANNIAAFVLDYTCKKQFPIDLVELAAAFVYVREHSEEFNIDPKEIFICGFSAGGHLAASLAVHWNKPFLYERFGKDPQKIKPCGAVLCYPVITAGEKRHDGSIQNLLRSDKDIRELISLEKQVDSDTVPTFIWTTADDNTVPVENTILYTAALAKYNIPFTSHIFSSGAHGLSLCDGLTANYPGHINRECSEWVRLALEWIRKY